MSEVEEITPEVLNKLLEKATDAETRFLLFLETQHRPGAAFTDVADFDVVLGEVEKIELEHAYNYPHYSGSRYLIIPKTIPVVIQWWHRWDFGNDQGYEEKIYVFTKDGWKVVEVK
jgi:hypothetical protein